MDSIAGFLKERLIGISMEEIARGDSEEELGRIDLSLPIYISIDKDVLSPYYARTNWSQGTMTADILKRLLLEMFLHQRVIGVDLCGECSFQEPLPQFTEDIRINAETNQKLYEYLLYLIQNQQSGMEKEGT